MSNLTTKCLNNKPDKKCNRILNFESAWENFFNSPVIHEPNGLHNFFEHYYNRIQIHASGKEKCPQCQQYFQEIEEMLVELRRHRAEMLNKLILHLQNETGGWKKC